MLTHGSVSPCSSGHVWRPLSCLILTTLLRWGKQALWSPFSRWRRKDTERCGMFFGVTQHVDKRTQAGIHSGSPLGYPERPPGGIPDPLLHGVRCTWVCLRLLGCSSRGEVRAGMEKRRLFVSNYLPQICSVPVSVTATRMEVMVRLVSRGPSCPGRQTAGRFGGPRRARRDALELLGRPLHSPLVPARLCTGSHWGLLCCWV